MQLLALRKDPFSPKQEGAIVSLTEHAVSRKKDVLAMSQGITEIATEEQMEACNPVLRSIKGALKECEDSRKELKEPVLEICKKIDKAAKDYIEPLLKEEARLKGLTAGFIQSQQVAQIQDVRESGETEIVATGGSGISAVEVWDFTVEDEKQAYLASPGLFELVPKKSAIIAAGKAGFPTPFIKVFKTTGVRVKA